MALMLIDLDGVVADMWESLDSLVGEPVIRGEWDTRDRYPGVPRRAISSHFARRGFFRNLTVIPRAKEGVAQLVDAGHDVWFCSTPVLSPWCASEKAEWVREHFWDQRRRLILSKDKTLVVGDYLIDDKPEVLGCRVPAWTHVRYGEGSFEWGAVGDLIRHIDS